MQYCSSQYQTLLSTPDTSTTKHHFHFGPASSFVLELCTVALHYSPIAYWTSSNLGGSSSSVLFFHLFTLSMGFSRQEHCSGSLFPPPVDHILSVLFTVTCPSWVALHVQVPSLPQCWDPQTGANGYIKLVTIKRYMLCVWAHVTTFNFL